MARRTESTQSPQPNGFERAIAAHQELVKTTPVDLAELTVSLSRVLGVADLMLKAQELGTVRFANQMSPLYAGALALNEQGMVRPPLADEQITAITNEIDKLSLFTDANGETGQGGPTNTDEIKTNDKK